MKTGFLAVVLAAAVSGCTSIESAVVASNEVTSPGGEAIAVVQVTSMGWTLLFDLVDIVVSDLDQVINKLLVGEAKAMGGSKIDLKSASTSRRQGIFRLVGLPVLNLTSPVFSTATGVVLK